MSNTRLIEVTTSEDSEHRFIEASDNPGDEAVGLYLDACVRADLAALIDREHYAAKQRRPRAERW